ncbi:MAG: aminodeoxychorismate lyase [Lachnospiraceae bacterium]|nr:aminodeoxychorismate lyase [Lachnospiraceae bacterium]
MNSGNLVSAVLGAILKVVFAVAVIYAIYQGATVCYDYGYRIFTEPALSQGEGRTVTVTVSTDMSPLELGELFLNKGLIKDDKLFALQYLLSEYREDMQSGTFELSTAMTAEEMMEVMATSVEEAEGSKE